MPNEIEYMVPRARGCGMPVKSGTYLASDGSSGGSIKTATWLLDWCLTDAPSAQFTVQVPPRAMMQIDPLASVLTRSLVPPGTMEPTVTDDLAQVGVLGRFGLADHVGESNYTPWSFFQELREQGPSRRVPHAVAAELAKHLPCTIIFFMPLPIIGTRQEVDNWLTFGNRAGIETVAGQRNDNHNFRLAPTWEHPRWTILTRLWDGGPRLETPYYGEDHFEIAVIAAADFAGSERNAVAQTWVEMPFAVSVITKARYILRDGEDALPEDLADANITPVRLIGAESEDNSDDDE